MRQSRSKVLLVGPSYKGILRKGASQNNDAPEHIGLEEKGVVGSSCKTMGESGLETSQCSYLDSVDGCQSVAPKVREQLRKLGHCYHAAVHGVRSPDACQQRPRAKARPQQGWGFRCHASLAQRFRIAGRRRASMRFLFMSYEGSPTLVRRECPLLGPSCGV